MTVIPEAPPPPAPARRRSAKVAAIVIAGVLVAAVATVVTLSAARKPGPAQAAAITVRTGTPTPTASDPVPRHAGDLRTFLLPRPSGARLWAQPPGVKGTMTLAAEASFADYPSKRLAYLKDAQVNAIATTTWMNGAVSVEIRLFRFAGVSDSLAADNAWAFFDHECGYDAADSSTESALDGVPLAQGQFFSFPKTKSDDAHLSGITIAGDVVAHVWIYPNGAPYTARAEKIIADQWKRLSTPR